MHAYFRVNEANRMGSRSRRYGARTDALMKMSVARGLSLSAANPPLFGHDLKELIKDLKPESRACLKAAWLRESAETLRAAKKNRKK